MALRKILTQEDPALHKVCRTVTKFDEKLATLLDDMVETLIDADGVGLAAPQIGILRRVVVVDDGEDYLELVNPELIEQSGESDGMEGCLSVPGEYWMVKRPSFASVRAQDRYGEWFEVEGEDVIARCFCHELEHLDGHLFTEKAYRRLSDREIEEIAAGGDR